MTERYRQQEFIQQKITNLAPAIGLTEIRPAERKASNVGGQPTWTLQIMSAIDVYKHNHLGFIECPSTYSIIDFKRTTKNNRIAIYELLENIPKDEKDFDGKAGDILVGGGSGEAPSLRLSNPIAFQFSTYDEDKFAELEFDNLDEVFKSFWTPTQSFILGEGFLKLGWTPDRLLEIWLTENICKLLTSTIDNFAIYKDDKVDLKTNLIFIREP